MLKRLSEKVSKNSFARSVMTLTVGTVVAQGILIASSPILTRIYTPSDFGQMSVFIAMFGLFGAIGALRFELAIPLPEQEREATALVVLGSLIVLFLSIILLLATLEFGESIGALLDAPELFSYLWLLPVAFFFNGIFMLFNMLSVRHSQFGNIAVAKIAQSVVTVTVQIIGAPFGWFSLILGRVLGHFTAMLHLLLRSRAAIGANIKGVSLGDLQNTAKNYRKFPLISTWSALTSSIGVSATPLLMTLIYGNEFVGYFAVTMMVMVAPMSIVGVAIQNVFFRQAVHAHRKGCLSDLILAVHSRLVLTLMPLFLLASFVLPEAFAMIFGSRWETSGLLAVWILPWMFFQLTVTPCTGIFPILDRLGVAFLFDLGLALAPFVAFLLSSAVSDDPLFAVRALSALACTIYILRISIAHKLSGGSAVQGISVFFRWLPIALIAVAPMLALVLLWPANGDVMPYKATALALSLLLTGFGVWRSWAFLPPLPAFGMPTVPLSANITLESTQT